MNQTIKHLVNSGIGWVVNVAARTSAGRYVCDQISNSTTKQSRLIRHQGVELRFCVPNRVNHFRVASFSTKEPETLEWIDGVPRGSVLWDVGANVGLYTCYAAKARGCRVFAFEPSVFNLELLARNIFLNGLTDRATIIPLPLSAKLAISTLNMTSTDWGGALSTFGQDYGHDGRALRKVFAFGTLGVSMMDAVELLEIPRPDYIKMDVDGIEHLILQGGLAILQQVQGILVEINDQFTEQSQASVGYLSKAGLTLVAKRHSQMVADGNYRDAFNQIWARVDTSLPIASSFI